MTPSNWTANRILWLAWAVLTVAALVAAPLVARNEWAANLMHAAAAAAAAACVGLAFALACRRNGWLVIVGTGSGLAGAWFAWQYTPTPSGWSNAEAARAAARTEYRLSTKASPLPARELGEAWRDADRLEADFPHRAERVRAARAQWTARTTAALEDLSSGRTTAVQFVRQRPLLDQIADDVPGYRERIARAERAWAEEQARDARTTLSRLTPGSDLRSLEEEPARRVLVAYFPDLAAALTADENAWRDRTAAALADAIRSGPADDPETFLRGRDAAAVFVANNPDRADVIRAAEAAWWSRCERLGLDRARGLALFYPSLAARELVATRERLKRSGAPDPEPAALKAELLRVVRLALNAGRGHCREAIRADRFRDATALADQWADDLRSAAALVGLVADLEAFRGSIRFLADLAEKVEQPDTKPN